MHHFSALRIGQALSASLLAAFSASALAAPGATALSTTAELSSLQIKLTDLKPFDGIAPKFTTYVYKDGPGAAIENMVLGQMEVTRSTQLAAPNGHPLGPETIDTVSSLTEIGYFQTIAPVTLGLPGTSNLATTTGTGFKSQTIMTEGDLAAGIGAINGLNGNRLNVKTSSGPALLSGYLSAGTKLEFSGVLSTDISIDQSVLAPLLAGLRATGGGYQWSQGSAAELYLDAYTVDEQGFINSQVGRDSVRISVSESHADMHGNVYDYASEERQAFKSFTISVSNTTGKDVAVQLYGGTSTSFQAHFVPVPEVQTWAMFGLGLVGIAGVARHRRSRAKQ